MGLNNGKTTTTMQLCCDPDSVDRETPGFGTASNHDYFSGSFPKLIGNEVYFSIQERFINTW